MSEQYPGGFINKTAPTLNPALGNAAPGIWNMTQVQQAVKSSTWPGYDPYYKNVTLNLHGNGTNGAQNNTFLDSSTNNFTITRNGNTTQGTYSPYGSNWSNYFDGASYFTSSANQIVPAGSFTVECWVYVTSTSNQAFVAQGTTGNAARFCLAIDANLWFAQIGSVNINAGTPATNTWNYIAVTFNGTTLTLYVNGTSVGTASTTTSAQNTTLAIGTLGASWATTGEFVTGYISNVRISNTVRTITTPTTPYTSDANTTFLFCASNRFVDSSSNAYAMTLSAGTPSVQRFSPFRPASAYSTSVIGGSGYVDGSGDYLSVANATALQLSGSQFTIEGWFYLTVGSTDNNEITCQSSGSADANVNFQIRVTAGNKLRFLVMSGASPTYIDSTATITTNSWHHFACVCDGSGAGAFLRMWVDGIYQTASSSFNAAGINTNTAATQIGAWTFSSQYLTGYLSDFRILKGTALYTGTSNITVPTSPLTAITNTSLLLNYTNAAIFDNAMMNDLETVGNAQISTSVYKYGGASMYFDGTGDGLQAIGTPNTVFGTGDFTVEFWIYLNANTGTFKKFVELGTSGSCFTIETQGTNNVLTVTDLNNTVFITASSALSLTTWTHVAVTRSGTSMKLFQDGVQVGSATNSTNFANSGNVYIGQSNSGQAVNCYMDDLRITKGVARYTTTFTPPTSQLQDQ